MTAENSTNEDPLSILKEEARDVAIKYGAQWCEEATTVFANRIILRLGGVQIYVPRQSHQDKKVRDNEVRGRFNGRNLRDLAREFGVTERTIRRILHNS